MNFELTKQQIELYDTAFRFASDVLEPGAGERIAAHSFDRGLWEEAAKFGYASLSIPEEDGGSGLSTLETMLMVEALGKGCSDLGLAFSLSAHLFACVVPFCSFASQTLKQTYLPGLIDGTNMMANAATEPEAGSDIYGMKSTAERVPDGYRLNGKKCFITNAPIADYFLVYAKTNPGMGFLGISAFLVPKDADGLTIGSHHEKDCLSTCLWSEVYLQDVFVSESHRIGAEGAGGAMFYDSMIWEKGCLFAYYVGAMDRMLEKVILHARERQQFGRAIAQNQSVSNRIVDMKIRLDTSRLLLYRAGWLYDQGKDSELEIAMSKLVISESAVQSGLDAIQTFGGSAIEKEMGVMQLLLDAVPSRIFSGSNDIQRGIIARKLGL
ncbi:acyl-CoA dehydrogenase family protein [Vibrio mangrovi]|uniref:Acyl-CoA dehydrogenase n=1 Tax=Vibrio mangrovi TaxID=474394 RepID=A0A1Y6ISZ5_9VIBR|nr:acyl-CoA dehydrogenase family protein [Vibrio mangrovi]MDW6004477.1 acyl-CoA dehydrogenase family protein [Vibrio mangrovi]SMS00765.1 Acyl-CoA dehydrogenase [Vibrio mangrovi]